MVWFVSAEDSRNAQQGECRHRTLIRQRILPLIEAWLAEPARSPRSVACDRSLSPRWLSAWLMGIGCSEWVAARRIEKCTRLLRDQAAQDQTVTQIAFACGVCDLSTLHRQFCCRVGTSPQAIR